MAVGVTCGALWLRGHDTLGIVAVCRAAAMRLKSSPYDTKTLWVAPASLAHALEVLWDHLKTTVVGRTRSEGSFRDENTRHL